MVQSRPSMAEVAQTSSKRDSDLKLEAILLEVLSEPDARARRDAVIEADERDEAAIAQAYADLDGLIELICTRYFELEARAREEAAEVERLEFVDDEAIDISVEDDDLGSAADVAGEAPPELIGPPPPIKSKRPKKLAKRLVSELLYEDMLWLLSVNDGEGALISLERLLVTSEIKGELQQFIELNEERLLNLYKDTIFGALDKVPKAITQRKKAVGGMPAAYRTAKKVKPILALINGKNDLASLIKQSKFTPLETCCVINQLRRSNVVKL